MAKRLTYLQRLQFLIRLMSKDVSDLDAYNTCREEKADSSLKAELEYYRANPSEQKALFTNYHKLLMKQHEKNEDGKSEKKETYLNERSYLVAKEFIESTPASFDSTAVEHGFEGHGPQPGRPIVYTCAEITTGERAIPGVDAGTCGVPQGVPKAPDVVVQP